MSSVFSSCARESSPNEYVRSTSAWSSSTASVSAEAAIATICWASTSSGLRGTTVRSISPSRMRRATTAHSSRSARNLGKMRPLETSPTPWPARPMRCRPGGDRLRRLDLEDEVDGAHVDAELERARRHEAGQLAGLELLLDDEALLARQRAVVGARDRLLGELVEAQREPLGGAPVVDEDDRRAVLADEREQLGVDRGPDRLARRLAAGERVEVEVPLLGLDHALDRHVDLQVERLARARVDDRARPLGADEEAADLLQRVLRRGQPDPLDVAPGLLGQPLERDREVRAALGLRDGVDLVDDHLLDVLEDLARLAGEHQVQRLGRRDEDVRRVAAHVPPLLLRRVAGADRDLHVRADPAQRRAQVLLHVVGERLERRDVDEPRRAAGCCGSATSRSRPRGTRRASCPSRSARRSACARRWRSRARPAPGPASAPRTPARTTRAPGG